MADRDPVAEARALLAIWPPRPDTDEADDGFTCDRCGAAVCADPERDAEGICDPCAQEIAVAAMPLLSALADETEQARARADAAERALIVPGSMRCAACGYREERVIISATTGATGAGDNKTEPCPNGCGPLWPLTWEQDARGAYAVVDQWATRAEAAEKERDALRAVVGMARLFWPDPYRVVACDLGGGRWRYARHAYAGMSGHVGTLADCLAAALADGCDPARIDALRVALETTT